MGKHDTYREMSNKKQIVLAQMMADLCDLNAKYDRYGICISFISVSQKPQDTIKIHIDDPTKLYTHVAVS